MILPSRLSFSTVKTLPLFQTPPVVAFTVSGDTQPVATRQVDLTFLENLKLLRLIERQNNLPPSVVDRFDASFPVTVADDAEPFAAQNPRRILVELHHQPRLIILAPPLIRVLPLQRVKLREKAARSQVFPASSFASRIAAVTFAASA